MKSIKPALIGLAALVAVACGGAEENAPVVENVPEPVVEAETRVVPDSYEIGGVDGFRKTQTFEGTDVYVHENISDSGFIFYRDNDCDGCMDMYGDGVYMMGLSRRFSDEPVKKFQHCFFTDINDMPFADEQVTEMD